MKKLFILFLIISAAISLSAQVDIQWQKCYGGTGGEVARSIIQTTDGGYVFAGGTRSNDFDVSGNHDTSLYYNDIWVVKTDSIGNIQWQKCLGGTIGEVANSIIQTIDGGYVIAGYTNSNDGDVSGNHGGEDMWIVKLDYQGSIQWQKCLGGSHWDEARSIIQTTDGGYAIAGFTYSDDGDVTGYHDTLSMYNVYNDMWIVKLDLLGNIQWQKCLGGTDKDEAWSILQTIDGGYTIAGLTWSNNGDISGSNGADEMWLVKLDPQGDLQWQKCFGGTSYDEARSFIQTTDGGYALAGEAYSNDGDVSGNNSSSTYWSDIWVVKTDSLGNIQWQKCLGGFQDEHAYSIIQAADGGYVVEGEVGINGGDVSGAHGANDIWVVKLDQLGNMQWQKCFGGTGSEFAYSIIQTTDGSYVFAGCTGSNDGDVSGIIGGGDVWVVKLNEITEINILQNEENYSLSYPNPSQENIYINLPEYTRKVQVYNTNGDLIREIIPQKPVAEINVQGLPAGVYAVRIYHSGGVVTTKFVKE